MYAELCAGKLRNAKIRNHFNPTRHTFFYQGELYIKMADIMDATVSPSQALFKLKVRNAGRARLISAFGNETLVTAISNSMYVCMCVCVCVCVSVCLSVYVALGF